MTNENPGVFTDLPLNKEQQQADGGRRSEAAGSRSPSVSAAPTQASPVTRDSTSRTGEPKTQDKDASPQSATVLVRGETVRGPDAAADSKQPQPGAKAKAAPKPVSEAKVKLQGLLPKLADDLQVGVQKDQVVTRDGKADLAFSGTLLASAAPASAPKGKWQEYRVYQTTGGKHVFSKVSRSVLAEDEDEHEAEIFDPSPSSMPSQLLRSARDLTRSQPLTWKDAAVDFFGYDPLAKALYQKLGDQFEEHIS
jgi:hypothetical protein